MQPTRLKIVGSRMSPVTASVTFLQPVKAQERTYRLLADDGLETVEGSTVQGLVDTLDLQSDLESKMVIGYDSRNQRLSKDHYSNCSC